MAETGRYLYAVCRGLEPSDLEGVSGLDGARLELVHHQGLVAVVSDVDLDEYGEEGLRRNLEELANNRNNRATRVAVRTPTLREQTKSAIAAIECKRRPMADEDDARAIGHVGVVGDIEQNARERALLNPLVKEGNEDVVRNPRRLSGVQLGAHASWVWRHDVTATNRA